MAYFRHVLATVFCLSACFMAFQEYRNDVFCQHLKEDKQNQPKTTTMEKKQSVQENKCSDGLTLPFQQEGVQRVAVCRNEDHSSMCNQSLPFRSLVKQSHESLSKTVFVANGNTLASILGSTGVTPQEIHLISKRLEKLHNVKNLQIGQKIDLEWKEYQDGDKSFDRLVLFNRKGNRIIVRRIGNDFEAQVEQRLVKIVTVGAHGTVHTNLSDAAVLEGIPYSVVADMVNAINSVTDAKKLRPGSSFSVLYEETRDEQTGQSVGRRVLRCVVLRSGAQTFNLYNFGNNKFYNEKGESAKADFLTLPLNERGVRISSKFGYRLHPCLHIRKYHTGIDYVAKYGTAVHAAADGVVVKAGRLSGYGLYLRIRHANGYETAYAHMSEISVRKGTKVHQGDIIGRVGHSGRVTGTHLHHEVIHNNKFVDPQKCYKLGRRLTGADYQKFKAMQRTYAAKLLELSQQRQNA